MLVETKHPTAGTVKMVGVPVKLSETPGSVRNADGGRSRLTIRTDLPRARRAAASATCEPIESPSGRACEVSRKLERARIASRISSRMAMETGLLFGRLRRLTNFLQQALDALFAGDRFVVLEGELRGAAQPETGGDALPETGRADDPLFYRGIVENMVGSGQSAAPYTALFRITDAADANDRSAFEYPLLPDLTPLTSDFPRLQVFQRGQVGLGMVVNERPSAIVLLENGPIPVVGSGGTLRFLLASEMDAEGDAVKYDIDSDFTGTFVPGRVSHVVDRNLALDL